MAKYFSRVKPKMNFLTDIPVIQTDLNGSPSVVGVCRDGFQNGSHSSIKTIGYRNIRKKSLPLNPFYSSFVYVRSPVLTWSRGEGDPRLLTASFDYLMGYVNPSDLFSPAPFADVTGKCRDAARKSVNDVKINLAVATGERAQTAKHLNNTVQRVVKLIRAFKKADLVGVNNILFSSQSKTNARRKARLDKHPHWNGPDSRDFGSAWLEYKYAWTPLLSDVKGAAEALARAHTEPQRLRTRTSRSITTNYAGLLPYPGSSRFETSYSIKCAITLSFKPTNELLSVAASFNMLDPIGLAWELVPFSFVVDWFLPIGNLLESISATHGMSFVSGTETIVRSYKARTYCSSNGTGWFLKPEALAQDRFEAWIERTVLTTFPEVSRLRFRNPLSISNAITSVALVNQLFRK